MATDPAAPVGVLVEVLAGRPPAVRYRAGLAAALRAGLLEMVPELAGRRGLAVQFELHGRWTEDYEYAVAVARHGDAEVWRGEFRTSELLQLGLLPILRRLNPAERVWILRIAVDTSVPPAPVLTLPAQSPLIVTDAPGPAAAAPPAPALPRPPRLNLAIRPRDEEPAPLHDTAPPGLVPPGPGEVCAVYSATAHFHLLSELLFSDRREDGGFLEGRVDTLRDGGHIVYVDAAHPAEHGRGSAVDYVFTGESFSAISRRLEVGGRRLVGWYHTHLMPPSTMGLSTIDTHTHLSTFGRPWQIAALVNIDRGVRSLRTYANDGKGMAECAQWIADDRGGYRPAGAGLGR